MQSDLFVFERNNILYSFLSEGYLSLSIFFSIILGCVIFWALRFDKYCNEVFKSVFLRGFGLGLLLLLGVGVGFLYQGIFGLWVMVVFSLMVFLALIDSKKFAVPDWMNFGLLFIVIFGVIFFGDSEFFFQKCLEGFGLAGLFAILRIFGDMIFKREVLGEGDIVFIASSGFLFGVYDTFVGIFLGCIIASVWALILRLFGKKVLQIPLITFVVLGLFLGFFPEVYYG